MYDPKHEEGDSPIGHMSLFEGSISPNDVGQGQLGDCWLMSAIASLAEHPGALQKLFVDKQYQIRGKYNVRIYDSIEKKWIVISVDDYFPCSVGTDKPIFAQPKVHRACFFLCFTWHCVCFCPLFLCACGWSCLQLTVS